MDWKPRHAKLKGIFNDPAMMTVTGSTWGDLILGIISLAGFVFSIAII